MCADRGLLLDAATGKRIAEFIHEGQPELTNNFPNARFSPDGTCFATFDAWSSIMVWDTRTAKPRFPPLQHGHMTAYIAFSEDSRYLATGSSDHTARVFDLLSGQELAKLHHPHWVFNVAFSADGRLLLTSGRDGSARLWDWRTSKLVRTMSQGQEMHSACFLPGSPWLVTGTGVSIQAWDSVLGKAMTPLLPKGSGGEHFRLTLGGRQLAAFDQDGHVRVYDLSPLAEDKLQRLSAEQIRMFAEIQSMHTIDEGGGIVRMTTAEWLESWQKLRQECPDLLPWSQKPSYEEWFGADSVTHDDLIRHDNLGKDLFGRGRFTESEAAFREIVRLRPDDASAHYYLGMVLDKEGKPEAAEAEYRETIRLSPDFVEAHEGLGVTLNAKGRHKEAEAEFRQAVRLRPDSASAHYNLGAVLDHEGKLKEAEAAYREAIRLEPNSAVSHYQLGDGLFSQGRFKEAETEIREAIRLIPEYFRFIRLKRTLLHGQPGS
jgi:tetratricopeptide (TPR) repeat protein